jgi:hypothetical protein
MPEKLSYIKLLNLLVKKINVITQNNNRNLYIILMKFKFVFLYINMNLLILTKLTHYK